MDIVAFDSRRSQRPQRKDSVLVPRRQLSWSAMLAVTQANTPTRLRLEHLEGACGIDEKQPRLSWRPREGAQRQVAYRLRTKDWSSGMIEADNRLLVAFPAPRFNPVSA